MRVLIAEDEVSIAKALKLMLEKNKYTVDMVHSGTDALEYITDFSYDVLVLDIMMPGIDGLELLKKVRGMGIGVPALFLTAKGEVEDRVTGLNAGADDYLPKPFDMSEFLARVKALTRRSAGYTPQVICLGNTSLDCSEYCMTADGKSVSLNNKEFQLMEIFMRHPRQIFSAGHLFDRIWGPETETGIDVIWTYIGFLRRKLEQLGSDISIRTVRGAGYALELPQQRG